MDDIQFFGIWNARESIQRLGSGQLRIIPLRLGLHHDGTLLLYFHNLSGWRYNNTLVLSTTSGGHSEFTEPVTYITNIVFVFTKVDSPEVFCFAWSMVNLHATPTPSMFQSHVCLRI